MAVKEGLFVNVQLLEELALTLPSLCLVSRAACSPCLRSQAAFSPFAVPGPHLEGPPYSAGARSALLPQTDHLRLEIPSPQGHSAQRPQAW